MYNVSEAYKKAASLSTRTSKVYGTLTMKNGSVINFTSADILAGSLSIDNAAVNGQELNLGTVYAAKFQFSLKTEADRYSLYDAKVNLTFSLQLQNGTWEDVPLGEFYVSEAQRSGKYVALNGYDKMLNFDEEVDVITSGTPYDLLNIACLNCDVEMAQSREEIDRMGPGTYQNGAFTPYGFGVPADNSISTYRDIVSEVAIILGGFAIIDRFGKLKICRFGEKQELNITDRLRKKADIYDYKCEYSGLTAVINGNTQMVGADNKIVLELGEINYLQNGLSIVKTEALENIFNCIKDLSYTPCSVEYIGDPALDLGDVVTVSGYNADNTDGTFMCIMNYNWKFHGTHKLTAVGKNTKLAKAKKVQSTKTSGSMQHTANSAKTKTLIYTNSSIVSIGSSLSPVVSFDIPVEKETSISISGQMIFEITRAGTFQIVYKIDGEEVAYSPKQTVSEKGYCTMNILYALTGATVNKHNNFTVYIKTDDGAGTVEVGDCIIIASGYDMATVTDNTKKIQFEERMNYLTMSVIGFNYDIGDTSEITIPTVEE